jgi:hypothetical protein
MAMSSISVPSAGKCPLLSQGKNGFKQDFMDLVTSLQMGNKPAAEAAFAAVKEGFLKSPPTITIAGKQIAKKPSRRTLRRS